MTQHSDNTRLIGGEKLRGHLEVMILSMLNQQPSHGFELVKQLEDRGEGALRMREGTIYPVLYRMEAAGLLKATWDETEQNRKGPRRKIYSLTEKGQRQLVHGRADWLQFVQTIGGIVGA